MARYRVNPNVDNFNRKAHQMNKALFLACVTTSENVFYKVPTADGRVSTLKGNKRDILKAAKDWDANVPVQATMDGNNLTIG